jgi:glycosyltransferase involved in cell wall biosynthesis
MTLKRVCLVPKVSGVGGMVSFQAKLAAGLAGRGIEFTFDLADNPYQAVLVIGGTRSLAGLWRARREGLPVVQRLNGMNWLHRLRRTGGRHYLRSEYGNLLLSFIRRRLATHIVYQSNFSCQWWERRYGITRVPWSVVYNGVDLSAYSPEGVHSRPNELWRILLVEGSLGGGYESGLETAAQIAEKMRIDYNHPLEVQVVGRVSPALQAAWQGRASFPLIFKGLVPREAIPEVDRSAQVLFAADLNAACPNSVIEALACGLPVVSFDTGALPELVQEDAGVIVPYGGDPWKLDPPDIGALAEAATEVCREQERFRRGARQRAEEEFGLDRMVEGYLQALEG